MILITVGMQLGFDRLIMAMDEIAPGLGKAVVAQVGKGSYRPKNMEVQARLDPLSFQALAQEADLLVGHAGIGTIITAARASKPLVLFPRLANLQEHRNDHQLATVRNLEGRKGVFVAYQEAELSLRIEEALAEPDGFSAGSPPMRGLHEAVASFIATGTL
jgi:UDP-N-acetylglucosamine transferase subunit ALG13